MIIFFLVTFKRTFLVVREFLERRRKLPNWPIVRNEYNLSVVIATNDMFRNSERIGFETSLRAEFSSYVA